MKECWKSLPELGDKYLISSLGRVQSLHRHGKRILKFRLDRDGYLRCNISVNGEHKTVHPHKLVAKAFLSPRKCGQQVDHKNRDRIDNRAVNLRWVTPSENALNRKHQKESKFLGVYKHKDRKYWMAAVFHRNRAYYLGTFMLEKDAAKAYDRFCLSHKLDRQLNFPEASNDR